MRSRTVSTPRSTTRSCADLTTRIAAVNCLEQLGGPDARQCLLDATRVENPRLRAEVLMALGCIGDAETLPVLGRLESGATPKEQRLLTFVKRLIAFRLGRDAALPSLCGRIYDLSACGGERIVSRPTTAADLERGVWALGVEGLGVDPSVETAFSLDLGGLHFLLALDQAALAALAERAGTKVSCVLGLFSEEDFEDPGEFCRCSVILAEFEAGEGRVAAYHPDGTLVFRGDIRVDGERSIVSLRAIAIAEAPPAEIDLSVSCDARVEITRARFAPALTNKVTLQPLRSKPDSPGRPPM